MTQTFSAHAPQLAAELLASAAQLPIIAPHGHVPVEVLGGSDTSWRDPAQLFVTGDHYVVRMLYSLGITPAQLGMLRRDGEHEAVASSLEVWQTFCEARRAFLATPTAFWVTRSMQEVFDLPGWPDAEDADASYDRVAEVLARGDALDLLRRQGVSYISTTDSGEADLATHARLAAEGAVPRVAPTFRPDELAALDAPGWSASLAALSARSDREIVDLEGFLDALRSRRADFVRHGATASDHGVEHPVVRRSSPQRASEIFDRALRGVVTPAEAREFESHMLYEHARMSADDGLVMQLHAGAHRDHHGRFVAAYGQATGSDIPVAVDFTAGLHELLADLGAAPGARFVLFTLDEATYTRELAPLAGHYPAVRLGPPWWFLDSPRGIRRYLDTVVETAGLLNLAGFNDDTRNVATVSARHGLWRAVVAGWLADVVGEGRMTEADATWAMRHLAHDAAVDTYRLLETGD